MIGGSGALASFGGRRWSTGLASSSGLLDVS
jgi:hypothetical protein